MAREKMALLNRCNGGNCDSIELYGIYKYVFYVVRALKIVNDYYYHIIELRQLLANFLSNRVLIFRPL